MTEAKPNVRTGRLLALISRFLLNRHVVTVLALCLALTVVASSQYAIGIRIGSRTFVQVASAEFLVRRFSAKVSDADAKLTAGNPLYPEYSQTRILRIFPISDEWAPIHGLHLEWWPRSGGGATGSFNWPSGTPRVRGDIWAMVIPFWQLVLILIPLAAYLHGRHRGQRFADSSLCRNCRYSLARVPALADEPGTCICPECGHKNPSVNPPTYSPPARIAQPLNLGPPSPLVKPPREVEVTSEASTRDIVRTLEGHPVRPTSEKDR